MRRYRIRNRWAGGHGGPLPLLHVPQVSRQCERRLGHDGAGGLSVGARGGADQNVPVIGAGLPVLLSPLRLPPPAARRRPAVRARAHGRCRRRPPARARACISSPVPWRPGTPSSTICRNMNRIRRNSVRTPLRWTVPQGSRKGRAPSEEAAFAARSHSNSTTRRCGCTTATARDAGAPQARHIRPFYARAAAGFRWLAGADNITGYQLPENPVPMRVLRELGELESHRQLFLRSGSIFTSVCRHSTTRPEISYSGSDARMAR